MNESVCESKKLSLKGSSMTLTQEKNLFSVTTHDEILETLQHPDFTVINSWMDYLLQSHDGNLVHRQFDHLLRLHQQSNGTENSKCGHVLFEERDEFLQLMQDYMNYEAYAVKRMNVYMNQSDSLKHLIRTGLCADCIFRFIIKQMD